MADQRHREIDANGAAVLADGSLQLTRIEIRQRRDPADLTKLIQEISNPQLVCLIRRDLWLEVENLDLEPADLPKLAAVN